MEECNCTREKIYYSLDSHELFPEERKWCRKKTLETDDLPYIDPNIEKDLKIEAENIFTEWINHKNANMTQKMFENVLKIKTSQLLSGKPKAIGK